MWSPPTSSPWPRRRYSGDDEAASYANKLAEALASDYAPPDSSTP